MRSYSARSPGLSISPHWPSVAKVPIAKSLLNNRRRSPVISRRRRAPRSLGPSPMPEHSRAKGGQIVLQMEMVLEDRPEDVGHGEDDADEGYIRQGAPLLPLPQLVLAARHGRSSPWRVSVCRSAGESS